MFKQNYTYTNQFLTSKLFSFQTFSDTFKPVELFNFKDNTIFEVNCFIMSENDPCECFWNHELSMQRLLSMLRQSQSACTDIDCVEPAQGLTGPLASNNEDTNFILLTGIWVVIALALYFLRPNPARIQEDTITKLPPGGSGNNGSDDPPSPPPPSMGAQ